MGIPSGSADLSIEQKGKVYVLRIKGRLDALSCPLAEKKIFEAIHDQHYFLLLDMSQVGYLSSAGMRMLFSISKKLKTLSGKMALCSLQTNVADILKMSGFDHALHLFKTEEDALKIF